MSKQKRKHVIIKKYKYMYDKPNTYAIIYRKQDSSTVYYNTAAPNAMIIAIR